MSVVYTLVRQSLLPLMHRMAPLTNSFEIFENENHEVESAKLLANENDTKWRQKLWLEHDFVMIWQNLAWSKNSMADESCELFGEAEIEIYASRRQDLEDIMWRTLHSY